MQRQRQFKPNKSTSSKKFSGRAKIDALYDSTWEKYRIAYLCINTRCYACGKKSEVVDHLTPHKGDENLFKKLDNHIPLCTKCHNTATALFDKMYRVGSPITDKLTWLKYCRNKNGLDFKVMVLPRYG